MLKLLIADSAEEFRMALTEAMSGSYVLRSCAQGKQALEMIHTFQPDILVLDLMLPELDGLGLLQILAQEGRMPIVLATTRFINGYVLDTVSRLGVGYVMVKPCDVQAIAARVRDLSQRQEEPPARPDLETVISNVLMELGIGTRLRGYQYLREAIAELIRHPGLMITKELYPEVGRRCNAKRDQVERSIRSAIGAAYQQRDDSVWRRYFLPGSNGMIPRPSNGTFITMLADRLSRSGSESIEK